MNILRPTDIEDEIRLALKDAFTTYVRPLPKNFSVPSLLITATGGTTAETIDTFTVTIDARAETDAEANELIRNAIGVLEYQASQQVGALRSVRLNAQANWRTDPVRPELKMQSATFLVVAHREQITL